MSEIAVTKELSSSIKKLRKITSTHAKELAGIINRSTGYISNLENGKTSKIDLYDIINIFEFFNERANSMQDDTSSISIKEQCSNIINNYLINETDAPLDDKEIQERTEYLIFDKQFRTIQITAEFKDYVITQLNDNKITAGDVIDEVNLNRDLPNADTLPKNKIVLNASAESIMNLMIAFDLDRNYLADILDGKIKSTNYITLQGIVYAILFLSGMSSKRASVESTAILYKCKIYNSMELKNIMFREKVGMIVPEVDSSLPKDYIDLMKIIKDIVDIFSDFNETDHEYTTKKLADFLTNLNSSNESASFTFGCFSLPFHLVNKINQEERIKLYSDIVDLIVSRCSNNQSGSGKIDIY